MTHFDVFNGDADGLCALHQLRLVTPLDSVLVTGAKRDIALLQRVAAEPGDTVTALDISLAANREALMTLLDGGVAVEYFDHHHAGDIPVHPGLCAHIDTAPDVCTGILVDRHLGGAQRIWAVVAAFGDNLTQEANRLAQSFAPDARQLVALRELGECLAYNAYGDCEADLLIHPAALYEVLRAYADPLLFIREEKVFRMLRDARRGDLALARGIAPTHVGSGTAVYFLPDAAWSRRVRGALGNELALREPTRAHAILTPNGEGGYTVSVRAPQATGTGADALCRTFASGGGRSAAAGINHLPQDQTPEFLRAFERAFP